MCKRDVVQIMLFDFTSLSCVSIWLILDLNVWQGFDMIIFCVEKM